MSEYYVVIEKVYKDESKPTEIEMTTHAYAYPPYIVTFEYETYTKYITVFKTFDECKEYYESSKRWIEHPEEEEYEEEEDYE